MQGNIHYGSIPLQFESQNDITAHPSSQWSSTVNPACTADTRLGTTHFDHNCRHEVHFNLNTIDNYRCRFIRFISLQYIITPSQYLFQIRTLFVLVPFHTITTLRLHTCDYTDVNIMVAESFLTLLLEYRPAALAVALVAYLLKIYFNHGLNKDILGRSWLLWLTGGGSWTFTSDGRKSRIWSPMLNMVM